MRTDAMRTCLVLALAGWWVGQLATLNAQPALANYVLDLDGTNACLEFPRGFYTNRTVTIEGWVKWRSFRDNSRFFDFVDVPQDIGVGQVKMGPAVMVTAFRWDDSGKTRGCDIDSAPSLLVPNQWLHLAVVRSPNGHSLLIDGVHIALAAIPNPFAGAPWPLAGTPAGNFLGRGVSHTLGHTDSDLDGQIAEFRIWAGERTQEQIRETMFQRLTGREPSLIGLWNFEAVQGGVVKDLSPSGQDGKLVGNAKVVRGALPSPGQPAGPSVIRGTVSDAAGKPVLGAEVEAAQGGSLVAQAVTDAEGSYSLVFVAGGVPSTITAVAGRRSACVWDEVITPGERRMDFQLVEAVALRGEVKALDDVTPLSGVVVQALKPGAVPNADPPAWRPDERVVASTATDSRGTFEFPLLKPGAYEVRILKPGGAQYHTDRVTVPAAAAGDGVSTPSLRFRAAPFKKGGWKTYNVTDGLAGDSVTGLRLAEDGRLWVATWTGASEFDGNRFRNFTESRGLVQSLVNDVCPLPHGRVWFAHQRGLTFFDANRLTPIKLGPEKPESDFLARNHVQALWPDADGTAWCGRFDGGLAHLIGTNATWVGAEIGLTNIGVLAITRDARQRLWLGTRQGALRRDGTNWFRLTEENGLPSPIVLCLCPEPGGAVWLGTLGGAVRWDEDSLRVFRAKDGLGVDAVRAIHRSPEGDIWFAHGEMNGVGGLAGGVTRYDGRGLVRFTTDDSLPDNCVNALTQDPEGHLWFGTRQGLCRYDPASVQRFTTADGLGSDRVLWLSLTSGGMLWMGHARAYAGGGAGGGGATVWKSGEFRHLGLTEGLPTNAVTVIREAPDGRLWLGTEAGLAVWDQDKFIKPPGSAISSIRGMDWDQAGVLWIRRASGAVQYHPDGTTTPLSTTLPTLSERGSRVVRDAAGAMWVGSYGAGLLRYDGREFRHLSTNPPMAGFVTALFAETNGTVWVGSEFGGLQRWDGAKLNPVTVRSSGLPQEIVSAVFRDCRGLLWAGTSGGACAFDGHTWSALDERDGLGASGVHAIAGDRQGDLWFGTTKGLVRYRPATNVPSRPTLRVRRGDQSIEPAGPLRVQAGERLTFEFVGTDFKTRPEKRQYRVALLRGAVPPKGALDEPGWSEGSATNSMDWVAVAGKYTFAVQYIDRDLNYSPPAVAQLEVVLPWHANAWVTVPGGLAVAGLGLVSVLATAKARRRRREAEGLREQMYQQEHRARLELERENGERRRAEAEARQAKQAADDANKAKSQFLANMSHELRTPLNAIIGYSEMLQEEAADLGQKEFVPDLEKIHGAGKHLLTLINDILDLSKIEAGKMTLYLESFDVAQVIQDVATTVQPLVARNGNRLEVDCPPDIGALRADLTKVRQTLFNLLSNACKFTEKGTIRLTVGRGFRRALGPGEQGSAVPAGRETLSFTVTDTGLGMSPEQLSRLFQAFAQADASTTRKFGGTGLGLAISKKFCLLMGGDLAVQSELGHGSTFTMTLPVEVQPVVPPVETKTSPVLPAAAAAGPLVLVIDDDPAALDLLQRALTKDGFAVQTAAAGAQGLELARSLKPAVITLDVMMPGLDGWAVLSRLKADPATADIPVLMVTIVDDQNLGFALGAADYLTKPIDWERLAAVMNKYRAQVSTVTVLVVEDDLAVRAVLRRNLERQGWQVTEAENGRVGLERVAAQVPGVILLDLLMPEMDGFDFVRALRQRPDCQRLPVIVITAKDLTEEDRRRLNGQVTQILQKGAYSTAELIGEIRRLLAHSRSPASR